MLRRMTNRFLMLSLAWAIVYLLAAPDTQQAAPVPVEGQPLARNVDRLLQALRFLGHPLPEKTQTDLRRAIDNRDARRIQQLLDPHVLVIVDISPEARVKAKRGPAPAVLQQGGYTPVVLKVLNQSTVTQPLQIASPQAGPIFSGGRAGNKKADPRRFLDVEVYRKPPMTPRLSGLEVEYVIALIHSSEAGKREATLQFDIGQGTQDLGFRAEVPILFTIRPAIAVTLRVRDYDGQPTVGRFTFRDKLGRVYPPRAKRLAPDFFFQDQIYRPDGGTVLLPPGELTMEYGRGPEYYVQRRKIVVPEKGKLTVEVKLKRWINPMDYGYYSGDHHIHAAGCAHYTSPTEGVFPKDMFLHVKGEGLNVGCNLTWGPCFEFQRQFFTPGAHKLSEPFTVLAYDIEVSGFGSQALGHVCLLNLTEQYYPGSEGTKTKGWPTWTTPLMRWAKKQGAFCGYAHSAIGLQVNAQAATQRLFFALDKNKDGKLSAEEANAGLFPLDFRKTDRNRDGVLIRQEIVPALAQVWRKELPNYAIPELNGIGAQEVFVTTALGLCDFISAMDTFRLPEWNCWYHIMNCGFPLKVSGETDFPCISGSRVGEGRVYVRLGKVERIDYGEWCRGLAEGRSYISDGYAHALDFTVGGKRSGEKLALEAPARVRVAAKVAFAKEQPLGTAKGGFLPKGPNRTVELVVNGKAVAKRTVPADDKIHDVQFEIAIDRSSWVALRHYPQMHTNPVQVIVSGKPIRASRKSALWCAACIEQLWRARSRMIAENERDEARRTFDRAIAIYRRIASECPPGS